MVMMMMMTKMTTICFAHCSFQTNVSRLPSAQNHFEADDDDGGDGDDHSRDDDHENVLLLAY